MAITPRLELRQGQTLVMTPQLQQSIKLVQLNNLELSAYVDDELEKNPLLERKDGAVSESEAGEAPEDGAADGDPMASDSALARNADMPEGEELADIDLSSEDYWSSGGGVSGGAPGGEAGDMSRSAASLPGRGAGSETAMDGIELAQSAPNTLREHLLTQLGLEISEPSERLIGSALIDMIDEAGYLTGDLGGDLGAVAERFTCPPERIESVLKKLQGFDPPGVFARDLGECLAIQLRDAGRYDPAIAALIDNLDRLAAGDAAGLKKLCGVDDEDLVDMVAEIKRLNPKPGLTFDHTIAQTIVPDVFVRPAPGGGWSVELNNETLPRVMVDNHYHVELRDLATDSEAKSFISNCYQNANWLVRALDQRARTILKVATELVRQQEAFFSRGVQELRPLTLSTVAENVGVHESTVSRVSNNKYIGTPRGTYEIKYFFSASLSSIMGGEAYAAEAIRHRIRELIDGETDGNILSDDRIAEILNLSGVDIARRTVAKYREAMHIPSSVRRRRELARAARGL
ncbi:MAG: RNA polymerase factor sigma-54 [Alphaproteobacteria bacterium]|nr:RNA polymerase factor sigma-54 [Alphaproteobacteria bacterium]